MVIVDLSLASAQDVRQRATVFTAFGNTTRAVNELIQVEKIVAGADQFWHQHILDTRAYGNDTETATALIGCVSSVPFAFGPSVQSVSAGVVQAAARQQLR